MEDYTKYSSPDQALEMIYGVKGTDIFG